MQSNPSTTGEIILRDYIAHIRNQTNNNKLTNCCGIFLFILFCKAISAANEQRKPHTQLAASNVSRNEMTRWRSTCGDGVLLPRESKPSRPPVGRQNGGCWMPFEYVYGGRQLCNSRLDQPTMVRGPGPSRKGLGFISKSRYHYFSLFFFE